jgi:hypothetical protein
MVIVSEDQEAVTPGGRPAAVPMPVAPEVLCVKFVNNVPVHKEAEEAGVKVLPDITVMVPVAFKFPQPPVKGIL